MFENTRMRRLLFKIVTMVVLIGFILWAVYGINGARGFMTPFLQIYAMAMAEGLFDRFFIDAYWVGHTKAYENYFVKCICLVVDRFLA